jgi:hypothetical protein
MVRGRAADARPARRHFGADFVECRGDGRRRETELGAGRNYLYLQMTEAQ